MANSNSQDAISRVKTGTKAAKSRGAATTPLSRKGSVAKKKHGPATPLRKSASVGAGKKLPPARAGRKP